VRDRPDAIGPVIFISDTFRSMRFFSHFVPLECQRSEGLEPCQNRIAIPVPIIGHVYKPFVILSRLIDRKQISRQNLNRKSILS
jgi:hypothetical protein